MLSESKRGEPLAALETVIIFSPRYLELADFYQRGLMLGEPNLSPKHIGFQVGPVYLGFDEAEATVKGSSVSLWFTVEDLQVSFDLLVSMGAEVRYPPSQKPWGGFLASVFDPEGNTIGLSQRLMEQDNGK